MSSVTTHAHTKDSWFVNYSFTFITLRIQDIMEGSAGGFLRCLESNFSPSKQLKLQSRSNLGANHPHRTTQNCQCSTLQAKSLSLLWPFASSLSAGSVVFFRAPAKFAVNGVLSQLGRVVATEKLWKFRENSRKFIKTPPIVYIFFGNSSAFKFFGKINFITIFCETVMDLWIEKY